MNLFCTNTVNRANKVVIFCNEITSYISLQYMMGLYGDRLGLSYLIKVHHNQVVGYF